MWFSQYSLREKEFEPVLQDGTPLRLYMWGKNLFTGGHFDAYIVDYYDYQPGSIDEDIFSVPDNCPKKLSPDLSPNFGKAHWHTKLRAMLPSRHYGEAQSCPILPISQDFGLMFELKAVSQSAFYGSPMVVPQMLALSTSLGLHGKVSRIFLV